MNFARIAAAAAALVALWASSAHALTALAVSDVKVRQGPGTNYRIVGIIPGGSTVEVSGCRGRWCMIAWQGHTGYATAASFTGSAPPPGAGGRARSLRATLRAAARRRLPGLRVRPQQRPLLWALWRLRPLLA